LLQSFASAHRASRYLLHTELVEALAQANVRYLATGAPMAPMLEPSLQYWQHVLGYSVVTVALRRTRLQAEQTLEFAFDGDAERETDRVMAAL
jgi:hypothetical protein